MQATSPLGNDIVDLRLPENQRSAADPRYITRVISPQERDASAFVAGKDQIFWAYWAAKEAAYKALVKTDPALIFAHRCFQVYPEQPTTLLESSGNAVGLVRYEALSVPVSWVWNEDWVHCLTGRPADQQTWRVGEVEAYKSCASFQTLQQSSKLAHTSVVNRLLARALLLECGRADMQIVRRSAGKRRGPPQLELDGQSVTDVDVSLSHDGRYSAAAIRLI